MSSHEYDVAVIGAGPAGLAAAIAAKKNGAAQVVVIERDFRPGGILEQCIHTGFGLKYFNEEMAGPEYAQRFIDQAAELGVTLLLNTMVLSIDSGTLTIHAVNPELGSCSIKAGAIILAMGCRERTRAAIRVPGTRPAGVYTAGAAQRFLNVQNYLVGKRVVILGSGDIGMIMARRLTLEGSKVEAVIEAMPYLTGLTRNRVQCLDDFGIPLYLSHTISDIKGKLRVEGVSISKVDSNMHPIKGTEFDIECDTVLFSVGLIPENELSSACGVLLDPVTSGPIVDQMMQTNLPGIFACGNVVHVNDLVDNVSMESEIAGEAAAKYTQGKLDTPADEVPIECGHNVRYTMPRKINRTALNGNISIYFRVGVPERDISVAVECDGTTIGKKKRILVNPGEIEMLELDVERWKSAGGGKLVISTVGRDA